MADVQKICNTCSVSKTLDCYTVNKRYKHGVENKCKDCFKEYLAGKKDAVRKAQQKWRAKNPEYMKEYGKKPETKEYRKEYYKEHAEENKQRVRKFRAEQPEKEAERRRKYAEENRDKLNEYHRNWKLKQRTDDVNYKLKENTSRRIRYELNTLLKGKKTKRTYEYIGCSIEELKTYIANKLSGEMTWENYGSLWHIDHIIPCAAWNLQDDFENQCCWNYRNLQPLLSHENQSKRDKYDPEEKEAYAESMKSLFKEIIS
jgi:hypothetical protein